MYSKMITFVQPFPIGNTAMRQRIVKFGEAGFSLREFADGTGFPLTDGSVSFDGSKIVCSASEETSGIRPMESFDPAP
jgi:hypothetical protein